jgi:hypothetical protein
VRIALIVPLSPHLAGNGAAHRARFWERTLRRLGEVTVVVVPLIGPADHRDEVVVTPHQPTGGDLPELALRASAALGMQAAKRYDSFDLVLAFRGYLAPFAAGWCAGSTAPLIVDLDDDDVDFARQSGDGTAEQWQRLIELVDGCASATTIAFESVERTTVRNTVLIPEASAPRTPAPPPIGLIVGNFGYLPNVEGARWFVDEVLPHVQLARPDFVLRIVGPGSEALAPFGIGFVDNLAAAYTEAVVALVPLLRGSGTRIKAIEAWAHGVPVVGTTVGLSGLDYTPDRHALDADQPADFAAHIVDLLNTPSRAAELSSAGRQLVESRYSSISEERRVAELLAQMVAEQAHQPLRHTGNLTVSEVDDGLIVEEPITGQVHHLNPTAAIVFSLIDGLLTDDEIAAEVQQVFQLASPPTHEVTQAIDVLSRARVVVRHAPS